jgi:hypothetical protein
VTEPRTVHANTITPDPYDPASREVSIILIEDAPALRIEGDGRDIAAYTPHWDAGKLSWHRIQWHQPDTVKSHTDARRWWVDAYTRMDNAA